MSDFCQRGVGRRVEVEANPLVEECELVPQRRQWLPIAYEQSHCDGKESKEGWWQKFPSGNFPFLPVKSLLRETVVFSESHNRQICPHHENELIPFLFLK